MQIEMVAAYMTRVFVLPKEVLIGLLIVVGFALQILISWLIIRSAVISAMRAHVKWLEGRPPRPPV